jgi:xylulokinase
LKYLLGFDIGSSSIKVALLDADSGKPVASAFSPPDEIQISSPKKGFAEQDPGIWWNELIHAMQGLRQKTSFLPDDILAIGISYQMHGLVCLDKNDELLRPSIIWCDSRAVEIGQRAFRELGEGFCLSRFLNSPGNFTASKLKWVQENEPRIYEQIRTIMLPGDYIALRMTGQANTTISGLSEGVMWNYQTQSVARELLNYYRMDEALLPALVPTFGDQGRLRDPAARQLGLKPGIPLSYRAGDQPNNAYSLNVLKPGEMAATAGTSGVVYAVNDQANFDSLSRINSFVHVNHGPDNPSYGVLLCINGCGILNSWLRKNFFAGAAYADLNRLATGIPIGSDGLFFYPFGNGAERIFSNQDPGANLSGLQFNRHQAAHVLRAAQEGIVFALAYGSEIMREMGVSLKRVRAGYANLFLSDIFASSFANAMGCLVELYNTDGALGAARAAGVGIDWFKNYEESFTGMERIRQVEPSKPMQEQTLEAYQLWKKNLKNLIH